MAERTASSSLCWRQSWPLRRALPASAWRLSLVASHLDRCPKPASFPSQASGSARPQHDPFSLGCHCRRLICSSREAAISTLLLPLPGATKPLWPGAYSKAEWLRLESWLLAPAPLSALYEGQNEGGWGKVSASQTLLCTRISRDLAEVPTVML